MSKNNKNDVLNKTNILLESGTNELELLIFQIGDCDYGINVSKVREILPARQIMNPTPDPRGFVEGLFNPRNEIITLLNTAKILGMDIEKSNKDYFIITHFNKTTTAFRVNKVENIRRISWTDIDSPDNVIGSHDDAIVTGVVILDERIISILDFEKIVTKINPALALNIDEVKESDEKDALIIIAEDSVILNTMMCDALKRAGYSNLRTFKNGQDAYDEVCKLSQHGKEIDFIISDIEMPQMDGHRFCKLVKEDKNLADTPFILFSSLINEQMRLKGESLGADYQFTKPEINDLILKINEIYSGKRR